MRYLRRAQETLHHLPAVVPARFASRRAATSLQSDGVPDSATLEDPSRLATAEPDYAITRRLDRRRAQAAEPEPLRLRPPLARLPLGS